MWQFTLHRSHSLCVEEQSNQHSEGRKWAHLVLIIMQQQRNHEPHIEPSFIIAIYIVYLFIKWEHFPYCMYSYNKEMQPLAIANDITDGCRETRYNKIRRWCASRFRKTVLVHGVDKNAVSALRNLEAQLDVEIMAVMVRPSKQAKCRGILFLHRVTAKFLYQLCRVYDNVFWPAPSHSTLAITTYAAQRNVPKCTYVSRLWRLTIGATYQSHFVWCYLLYL